MLRFLFLLIVVFCSKGLVAQEKLGCDYPKADFGNHEYLKYKVSYNFGFIWIDAGNVDFKADRVTYKGKDVYHFLSTGISEKKWEWIYKVRDTFQVYSKVGSLEPIDFERTTLEGSVYNKDRYHFDFERNIVHANLNDFNRDFKTLSLPISECTFDILTATYVTRAMDFSKSWVGDTIPLKLIHDGRLFTMPIVFRGNETIQINDNESVKCIKFSAIIDKGTMFRSGEKITVWVTDDQFKVPVLIEAKIVVGSIKVYLTGR
ncbi:MAG: DUF3108 domain-containing protein [Bacteroidales bacterium]|nr:DUF3108 domain-containing protein [Bacteroidales bacterium]